jgi:hypothetical protein
MDFAFVFEIAVWPFLWRLSLFIVWVLPGFKVIEHAFVCFGLLYLLLAFFLVLFCELLDLSHTLISVGFLNAFNLALSTLF